MTIDLYQQLAEASENLLAAQRAHLAAVTAILTAGAAPAPTTAMEAFQQTAARIASSPVNVVLEPLDESDPNGHATIERPQEPGAAVQLPDDFPTELALTKGKLKLAAIENVNGNVRVALSLFGPRGGETKLGNLLATPDGNWQATTKVNKETKSQTEGSWREALDWVLVVHELQSGESAPAASAATAKAPTRGEIAAANDRLFAGQYEPGDGRLVFANNWQRADNCLNVADFLRVGKDSAVEMIERITGAAYNAATMVDAEALAKEIAGYHHDVSLFCGEAKPANPLVDGVDLHGPFGGDNPERFITEAEEAHAREQFAAAGITTDEAQRQILQDECDGTPSLDTCKLKDYKHLIQRVLPAKAAKPPTAVQPAGVTDADRQAVKDKALGMGLNLDQLRKIVEAECGVPDLVVLKDRKHWEHLMWYVLPAIANHRHGHAPEGGDRKILDRVAALGIPLQVEAPRGEAPDAVEPCPRCSGGAGLGHACSCSIEELQAHARGQELSDEQPDDELALLA